MKAAAKKLENIGPYTVVDEIGRGASSRVYKVARDGNFFALKIHASDSASPDALLRFQKEASTVARFKSENLVSVFDTGEWEGAPYLVMELIEGKDVGEHLKTAAIGVVSAIEIAKGVCRALVEIHRLGLVHRDIKPQNVIVSSKGIVKLADFGFAGDSGEIDRDEKSQLLVGTVMYAAPEQIGVVKRPVDHRSDLYSLGILLYECLSGQCPYRADSLAELVAMHAASEPVSLSEMRADISPVLDQVVRKLMRKDPDDRYQSAAGLLHDLENLGEMEEARKQGRAFRLGQNDFIARTLGRAPLAGRMAEKAELLRIWSNVKQSKGGFAVILGESGLGKSRLALEFMQSQTSASGLVLQGKCNPLNQSKPFAVLREAFDRWMSDLALQSEEAKYATHGLIKKAAAGGERSVALLSTQLRAIVGDPTGTVDDDPMRFTREVQQFLRNLALSGGTMVLFLDDIQWLDSASLLLLASLGLDGCKLLVLATARNDEESEAGVESFKQAVQHALRGIVVLQPLDAAAVQQIVRHQLGGRDVESVLIERISRVTNGNPFFVGEVLDSLISSGNLRFADGRWLFDEAALGQLGISHDIVNLVRARIHKMSPKVREVLSAASVIGVEFGLDVLAKIGNWDEDFVRECIAEATAGNLIEETNRDSYRFVHDKIRESLEGELDESAIRDLNDRIADCFLARKLDGDQTFDLAHYLASGNRKKPLELFRVSFQAASLADESFATDQAFEYLELASHYVPADLAREDVYRFYYLFGRICLKAGHPHRAIGFLDIAIPNAGSAYEKALALNERIESCSLASRTEEAWETLKEAQAVCGRKLTSSPFVSALTMLWLMFCVPFLEITGLFRGQYEKLPPDHPKVWPLRLAALNTYHGFVILYSQGKAIELVGLMLRQIYYSHFLGGWELAKGRAGFSVICAMLGLRRPSEKLFALAAGALKNRPNYMVENYVRGFNCLRLALLGDPVESERVALEGAGHRKKIFGIFLFAQHIGDTCFQYMFRGYHQEAVDFFLKYKADLDRSQSLIYQAACYAMTYAQLVSLGRIKEGYELRAQVEKAAGETGKDLYYVKGALSATDIVSFFHQGELGPEIDSRIDTFLGMGYETYHNSFFHCYIPYIRYGQWLQAKTEDEKAKRWRQLEKSTWGILIRGFNTGLYSCHANVARAMIARAKGRFSKAERLLRKAADQARFTDSVLGMFMVARERARLERALGFEDRAQYEAGVARRLAQKQNQVFMLRELEAEFGASKEAPIESAPAVGTMSRRSTRATVTEQIAFDALLKVSVAATRSVEPNLQAQMTLDEVIRVFGAERGYVFRWDENEKSLNFACGRDAAGAELPAPTGHSQTVVNRVLESREPLVLTGSDQMEDIGAKSAVIHGLRSIMAVPLFLQESFKGLVYLDSRLAKNLFNESDVQLFEAVAGHIAVAFEVSSMATLERQKAAFQKDLEVSGTVQRMFLPSSQTIAHGKISVAAFYRPAAQCGGDWWWHAEPTEDMIRVVVGDVTGHGAGPAMITALAATVARTSPGGKPEGSLADLFRALDENINVVANGEYWMTAMGLQINMKTGALQIVGASGPPAFSVSREGKLDTILSTSSPLGEGRGDPHVIDLKVKEGDRLVIFTDGIVETRNLNERVYGYRRLAQVLAKTNDLSAAACSEALVADLDKFRGELEQDDDMTFLIVDIAR